MKDRNEKKDHAPQGSEKPSGQQQQQGGQGQQYGEGSYQGTRDYDKGVKEHMKGHDVEKEARDAAPRSESEARDMERAEEIGRSRAKGDSKEMPEDPNER